MRTLSILLLLLNGTSTLAQDNLPVLKTGSSVLAIKDGDVLKKDYWYIDSGLEVDVYLANKTRRSKTVTFYSDVDSISFEVKPEVAHDFLIVLNETDTCYTRVKSGILTMDPEVIALKQDTIPFTLTDANNIIIEAILNEKDTVQMMFHTAQSSVVLTFEAIAKIESDRFNKKVDVESWGGEGTAKYSLDNELQVQDFKWSDVTIWADENTGPTADGKFGPNLFAEKVIELNFDEKIMVIHSRLPDSIEGYERLDLFFQDEMMFVETELQIDNDRYTRKVLIHSGFGGTLLLDEEYIAKHKLRESLQVSKGDELKDAYGNVVATEKVSIPQFALGSETFQALPIGFFSGKIGGDSRSVMGGNLIKRFNMYLDLQNAYIYIQPSVLNRLPFNKS